MELPLRAHIVASLQVVRAGPDRVAIAWIDSQLGTERPAVTFFDGFLKPTGVAVWLDDGHTPALGNRGRYVAAAYDGAHLLVTWTRADEKGRPRLVARASISRESPGRPRRCRSAPPET